MMKNTRHLLFRPFPVAFAVILFLFAMPPESRAGSEESAEEEIDFTSLSFEELKNVIIVTASRKPEKLTDSAAAVYVITAEDIRRSAATNVPEILRMAPGVQVSRINTHMWAISIRGFENQFANKLLVMIDGRSVYTTVFSGVYWDVQELVLEDIDRIEVIRGPGGSLWGANAVNGIINIITRKAGYETGGRYSLLAGPDENSGNIRYQGALDDTGFYRLYARYYFREEIGEGLDTGDEEENPSDNWQGGHTGFRLDLSPGPADDVMLGGEIFSNRYDQALERSRFSPPYIFMRENRQRAFGGHLNGRWNHVFSDESDALLHFFAEHESYDYETATGKEDTVNIDLQYRYKGLSRNDLVFGIGCRHISDHFENSFEIEFNPKERDHFLYSAFIQDKIEIARDSLWLVLGTKLEHNAYTGTEVQPSARFLWTPSELYSIWGGVSRAVRTPSRLDRDLTFREAFDDLPTDLPILVEITGNRDFDSENLVAGESGLRLQPSEWFWMDTAIFYHRYDDLLSVRARPVRTGNDPVFHYAVPYTLENKLEGATWGAEIAAAWRVTDRWRLHASYTWWHTKLKLKDPDPLTALEMPADESYSRWQGSLQSRLDITDRIEFDVFLRHTGRMPETDIDWFNSREDVGGYVAADARLAWKYGDQLEFSIVGNNLFDPEHPEYPSFEVERRFYGKIDICF